MGCHSDIYTRSEPWIALPLAYTMKERGIRAEYDALFQRHASRNFRENLPEGGELRYIQSVREMHLDLYRAYLDHFGKSFFLDKTPRYYLIHPQLKTIFPKSRHLILLRNPLAILNSMIEKKRTLSELSINKIDILEGVDALIQALQSRHGYSFTYETLLQNPRSTFEKLFSFLEVPFEPAILHNFSRYAEPWKFGDQNIYKTDAIDPASADRWTEALTDPQRWQLLYDYLTLLGPQRMAQLGYDFDANLHLLETHRPKTSPGITLFQLLDETDPARDPHEPIRQKLIEAENDVRRERAKTRLLIKHHNQLKQPCETLIRVSTFRQPHQKYKTYKSILTAYHAQRGVDPFKAIVTFPTDDPAEPKKKYFLSPDMPAISVFRVDPRLVPFLKGFYSDSPIYQRDIHQYAEGTYPLNDLIRSHRNIPWKVIIDVAEPIDRWIRNVMQNLDRQYRFLKSSNGLADTETIIQFIHKTVRDESLSHQFFDETVHTFGIDLLSQPFDQARGYSILRDQNIDILLYRGDHLHSILAPMLQTLFQDERLTPNEPLTDYRHQATYADIAGGIIFDQPFLEGLYNRSMVRHFYTDNEIQTFVERWAHP